jgi:hypothetical protein
MKMKIHGFGYQKMINPFFFTPYSPLIGGEESLEFWAPYSIIQKASIWSILIPVPYLVGSLPWVID